MDFLFTLYGTSSIEGEVPPKFLGTWNGFHNKDYINKKGKNYDEQKFQKITVDSDDRSDDA